MEKVVVTSILTFRKALFNILRHYYYYGPEKSVIAEFLKLEDSLAEEQSNEDIIQGLMSLRSAKIRYETNELELVEEMQREFSRLFIGPGKAPIPLYESEYRTPNSLLMQETAIKIRTKLLSSGLVADGPNYIPEDHLAMELEFLYCLSHEALLHWENDELTELASSLELQRSFLQERMDWINDIANKVKEQSTSKSITAIALLSQGILQEDLETLSALLDDLHCKLVEFR